MPPKAKFTRDEIIEAAFQLAREKGMEAVVAREVGKRLGTSSSPIFTAFKNMEELQSEVRRAAMKRFESYVQDALNYTPAFKYVGVKMIQFAAEEPKLFQLLYLQEQKESRTYEDVVGELGDIADVCMEILVEEYEIAHHEARQLFRLVWMQTFAICVLVASKVCHFTEEEISEMLSIEFQGTLLLIKSGGVKNTPISIRGQGESEKLVQRQTKKEEKG